MPRHARIRVRLEPDTTYGSPISIPDRSTIVPEVDAHIAEIGHEARNAWRELLAATDRSA
jgi:hypothetical protein